MRSFISTICGFKCDPSDSVIQAHITGLLMPVARPRAAASATKQYGTFYGFFIAE